MAARNPDVSLPSFDVWGDLLMWDNRCTLHARTDFSAAERRRMRCVTILGEKPV